LRIVSHEISSQLSALSKGPRRDSRPRLSSGAKLRPLCLTTEISLSSCIYRHYLTGFTQELYHVQSLFEWADNDEFGSAPPSGSPHLCLPSPHLNRHLAYGSAARIVRFVADSERRRRARGHDTGDVARLGSLRPGRDVRGHKRCPLQPDETRSGADDPIGVSAADAHRIHHRRLRVSRCGRFADSEIPPFCRSLPHSAALRNVHRQHKRCYEGSDIGWQARDSALAADPDAGPVHRPDLVGFKAVACYARRKVSNVISGGTPIRTGKPRVPRPRFT